MFKFPDVRRMTPEERGRSIEEARKLMQSADRVLIGAGAGLSTAAGLDHGGEAFKRDFPSFVSQIPEKPTLLLELGVGWNTPVWIRMPFERIAKATDSPLIRMNYDSAEVDDSIRNSVSIDGDMAETLPLVCKEI